MKRSELKQLLDYTFSEYRPRICLVCGKPFGVFDMHEGIVTRGDAQGWKHHGLIMNTFNCIPLHHSCHLDSPPSREAVWQYQREFFGSEPLMEWYTGLPWKFGRPPRFFEE